MSCSESSRMTNLDIGNICVGERTEDGIDDPADNNTNCVCKEGSSQDGSERERVLKEVGLTSTTFIGPALPSETVKSGIDDALSEFYKELEKVDTPDDANGNPGKQDKVSVHPPTLPKISNTKETRDVSQGRIVNPGKSEETDGYQKSSGHKQSSWPHWYENEPYYNRRPRPSFELSSGRAAYAQNTQHYPQPWNRAPNPRFHQPPFCCQAPLSEFPNPQNPRIHMNPKWNESGMSNHYQEDSYLPEFCSFPPPNAFTVSSQGFYGNSKHPFDTDEENCRNNARSENVIVRRSRGREEEWSQFGEDYDRHQRFVSENEQWEKQHHGRPPDNTRAYPSSLVLILMRGLPGSGKSTLARDLLSTGPSGLILSTDDYFAYKDGYCYEPGLLGVAHEWNQSRAKDAMQDGRSPIIIDNTNLQAWEMKPYVKMALERGYNVDFCEPHTSWKFDPYELEKRNKHGVPQEKIAQMLDRFSFPISIDIVMNSQEPHHMNQRRQPQQPQMMRNQHFH